MSFRLNIESLEQRDNPSGPILLPIGIPYDPSLPGGNPPPVIPVIPPSNPNLPLNPYG